MPAQFTVLIMAAGLGTRMRSELPKVLHPICGRPMVEWVVQAARAAGADEVVCITRPGDGVAEGLPEDVHVAEQTDGEGTGSAVLAARERLTSDGPVLILSGDHPLVSSELIADLMRTHAGEDAVATLLTTDKLDPSGYGRIVRGDDDSVERIVETKYPDRVPDDLLGIREINIGTYAFDAQQLLSALEAVELQNGERYLTGTIPLLLERGGRVAAHLTDDTSSALGVNTRVELMQAERVAQARLIQEHALAGVSFVAPESNSIDAGVEIGPDSLIEAGVTIRGSTRIGAGCRIGPQTTLIDASLGDRVTAPHSYLVDCEVEDGGIIGPFAYLRPGAHIGENAKVGTFVEVKNSHIEAGAKVPHLSYIGDADIGEGANIGAGNITANYDGRRKHRTNIGKRAKTGVDTAFVAPVSVGDDAYTGAGSVITEDVPDGALGISRPEQKNVEGYAKRVQEESEQ